MNTNKKIERTLIQVLVAPKTAAWIKDKAKERGMNTSALLRFWLEGAHMKASKR